MTTSTKLWDPQAQDVGLILTMSMCEWNGGGNRSLGQIIWLKKIHWMITDHFKTLHWHLHLVLSPQRQHRRGETWSVQNAQEAGNVEGLWHTYISSPTMEVLLPTHLPGSDVSVVALRKKLYKLYFKGEPREKTHSLPADTFKARNWKDESKEEQNELM